MNMIGSSNRHLRYALSRSMGALSIIGFLLLACISNPTMACSVRGYAVMPLVVAIPKDSKRPAVLDVAEIRIARGAYSTDVGSCDDAGMIEIVLGELAAGYHVQIKDGNLPPDLFPDHYVIPGLGEKQRLLFPWLDWPRNPATWVTASILIRAIDQYSNPGQSQVFDLIEGY